MNIWCISKYAGLPHLSSSSRLFYLSSEFKKMGHNVFFLTSDSNHLCKFPETNSIYNFQQIDGVNVCWIKTLKYSKTASLRRVLSWFDFELKLFRFNRKRYLSPDVVIVSSLSLFTIFYGIYLKKIYKSKLILEIRDIWPLTMTAEGGFKPYHPLVLLMGLVEKIGYKSADLIVGTMPRLDLHVYNILNYNRPFFCSPIGFDDSKLDSKKGRDELSQYFPSGKIIIGYAGSMGISNNLLPYIDFVKEFSHNDKICFVFAGSGDLSDKIKQELSGQTNVIFLGKIKSEYIPAFLSFCDILYLSTHSSAIWKYGQSMNKVLEYMLAAKPIIASYSGYPSMLNEAQAGFFIPVNDHQQLKTKLIELIEMSQEQRDKIGQRGREWVLRNRSYKTLAREYIEKIVSLGSNDKSN